MKEDEARVPLISLPLLTRNQKACQIFSQNCKNELKVNVTLKTRRCYESQNSQLVLHLFFCTYTTWPLLSLDIYWTAASSLSNILLHLIMFQCLRKCFKEESVLWSSSGSLESYSSTFIFNLIQTAYCVRHSSYHLY